MATEHSTWHVLVVKPAILLVFALLACDQKVAGGTADGAQVYQSVCATCHGADGTPPAAMAARLNVRDLTSGEMRARVTPELVEAQVRNGSQNKLMPAFGGALTEEQIKSVSAYVASPTFPR